MSNQASTIRYGRCDTAIGSTVASGVIAAAGTPNVVETAGKGPQPIKARVKRSANKKTQKASSSGSCLIVFLFRVEGVVMVSMDLFLLEVLHPHFIYHPEVAEERQ